MLRVGMAMSVLLAFGAAHAQSTGATGMVIYPAKGQSAKQQDQDQYECYEWARGQTGFDPAQMSQQPAANPSNASTGSAAGMAKGAMGGAAVAELADHSAGKGAAVGALGAAMRERAGQRQAAQAKEQQAAQQQAARTQQRSTYVRAHSACMEARGYVVK
jgi:hypothetical protein